MRVWSERVYGIPSEQVVGSTSRTKFEWRDGKPVLVKTTDHLFIDDKDGKPVGIHQFIGRRLIVHHTDVEREYSYDANPKSSAKLADALKDATMRGWTVVDMKSDWQRIFADQE